MLKSEQHFRVKVGMSNSHCTQFLSENIPNLQVFREFLFFNMGILIINLKKLAAWQTTIEIIYMFLLKWYTSSISVLNQVHF